MTASAPNYFENERIISAACIGECRQTTKMKLKTESMVSRPIKRKLDVENTSTDDLKSIQLQDPFMYYSIPGVRSAKVLMKDVDASNLGSIRTNKHSFSCPSSHQTIQDKAPQSHVVRRSSCISVECHPDLILGDLYNDDTDLDLGGASEPFDVGAPNTSALNTNQQGPVANEEFSEILCDARIGERRTVKMKTGPTIREPTKRDMYSRSSCISFEYHSDLNLGDILDMYDSDYDPLDLGADDLWDFVIPKL